MEPGDVNSIKLPECDVVGWPLGRGGGGARLVGFNKSAVVVVEVDVGDSAVNFSSRYGRPPFWRVGSP